MTNLATVLEDWQSRPFSYGEDCCQFAAAVVEAVHGYNPMARFEYYDQETAEAIVEQYGSLEAAMRAVLGDPIPVDTAREGDVLLIRMLNGESLAGVVICGRAVVRDHKYGVRGLNLQAASLAWRP